MQPDIATSPIIKAIEARRAIRQAERVAAVFVSGFIVVLAIAGYRIRIRSDNDEQDPDGTSSDYPGTCTGTRLPGCSDVGNLSAGARGAPPAVFRIHRTGMNA